MCPVSCMDMQQPRSGDKCEDSHSNCPLWFDDAECETNDSVKKYCPLSCGECQDTTGVASRRRAEETCEDNHEKCSEWAVRLPLLIASNCHNSEFLTNFHSRFHGYGQKRVWENVVTIQGICCSIARSLVNSAAPMIVKT